MGRTASSMIGTTILAVRHRGQGAMAGDGQVTLPGATPTVVKHGAHKIRRLYEGRVLAGFAGGVADAFTLFEKFEGKLQESHGNLARAAVALAREWRTDRILRRLEALLLVMDADHLFLLSGSGEVVQPDDGIAAIGSGGPYALAAARALIRHSDLGAAEIAREALRIAASIDVYTNEQIVVETIP